jgi:hypothetical protein
MVVERESEKEGNLYVGPVLQSPQRWRQPVLVAQIGHKATASLSSSPLAPRTPPIIPTQTETQREGMTNEYNGQAQTLHGLLYKTQYEKQCTKTQSKHSQ